jgi:transforming growth factor-beta-induced protein
MANVVAADITVSNGVIHAIDNVITPPTVVDLAVQNGNFNTLVSAVTNAGLAGTLSEASGTFTVFAPTDDAFAALSGNIPSDLTPILTYHVLGSPVYSDQVTSSIISSLNAEDPEIIVEVSDNGVMLNGKAKVIATDIVGTNGVIHVIDQVIMPINNNSIIDIAMGMSDKFSALTTALATTNLATTFMNTGAFTVFAPTNDAFAAFLEAAGVAFGDLTPEDLMPILKYHVIGAKAMSTDISTGYYNTIYTAVQDNPVSMLVEVNNGVRLNGDINVIMADVEASNGVVHVIDAVLTPPTVVDIAIDNNNFTQLVEAVVTAGLVETLSGEGPFTVFAPTDEAFEQVLNALGVNSINEIASDQLIPILQYHVVSGNVKSTDLSTGEVSTLNGNISVSVDGKPMINGDTEIIATDIQGTNGIVHVIDKVLIP